MEMVATLVKEDLHFAMSFLEHAKATSWFDLAIKRKLIDIGSDKWYDTGTTEVRTAIDYRKNMTISFLSRFCNSKTGSVLDYLAVLKDDSVTIEVLYNIVDWKNPTAIKLFEQCTFSERDGFIYYQILKHIAKVNASYCFEKLAHTLTDKDNYESTNRNEHQLKEILKILSSNIPEKLIVAIEPIIFKGLIAEDQKYFNIYDDHIYTGINFKDKENLYGTEFYYWLLAKSLRNAAETENPAFDEFVRKHLNSRYEAMLRLIIYAIKSTAERNRDIVYSLFLHLDENGHFMTSSDLGVEFRDIFQASFIHLNTEQQEAAGKIILHIKNPAEAQVWSFGTKPLAHLNWGNTQFALMRRLPTEFIEVNPKLKRRYQELLRRFKTFKEVYQNRNLMAGIVERPFDEDAYRKMSVRQWLNSFRKYHNERDPFREDFLKGGLREHSWAFRDYCKKFADGDKEEIIRLAIHDTSIHRSYPILGLLGLAEGGYDSIVVHKLFALCGSFMYEPENISNSIRITQYLLRDGIDDHSLIDIVVSQAIDWRERRPFSLEAGKETSIDGLIMKAINTTYSTAAESLLYIENKKYEEKVFDTIQKILKDGPPEARAIVLYKYAYLNNLNRDRAFDLFCDTLLFESNIYVKASSIWSLQYLGNYNFERLHFLFSELVSSDLLGNKDSEWLFSILYFSYLYEKPNAESLIHSLLKRNQHSRKWALREIFDHFYHNDISPKLSAALLNKLIDIEKNDPSEHFDLSYQTFNHIKLNDIESFLVGFVKLPSFALSDQLLKYLISQCNSYALQSVSIFNLATRNSTIEPEDSFTRNEEITRFIVGAYTSLKANDNASRKTRVALLASFDAMLKDYSRRTRSERILDELL
jgi:hypothetical protein